MFIPDLSGALMLSAFFLLILGYRQCAMLQLSHHATPSWRKDDEGETVCNVCVYPFAYPYSYSYSESFMYIWPPLQVPDRSAMAVECAVPRRVPHSFVVRIWNRVGGRGRSSAHGVSGVLHALDVIWEMAICQVRDRDICWGSPSYCFRFWRRFSTSQRWHLLCECTSPHHY
jgi:hypothetical protein